MEESISYIYTHTCYMLLDHVQSLLVNKTKNTWAPIFLEFLSFVSNKLPRQFFSSRSSHLQCSSLNRTFPSSEPLAHSLASTNHDRTVATQINPPHFCQATSGLKARACNGPRNAKFGHRDIRMQSISIKICIQLWPPSSLGVAPK